MLVRLTAAVLVAVVALIALTGPAGAATITQVHSQVGDENWNDKNDSDPTDFWSDGLAAAAGNDYVVPSGFTVRTVLTTSTSFNGDSITVEAGGRLGIRGPDGGTHTANFILDGDTGNGINAFWPGTQHLAGSLAVTANGGVLDLDRTGRNMVIDVGVTGGAGATLNVVQQAQPNSGASTLTLDAAGTFSGTWDIKNGSKLIAAANGSLGPSSVVVSTATAVFDPQYAMTNVASLTINAGSMILENVAHVFGSGAVTLPSGVVANGLYTGAQLNALSAGVISSDLGGTVQIIPEPSSLALIGMGLAMFAVCGRRKE